MGTGKETLLCDTSTDRDRPIVPKHYRCNVFNTLHKLSRPDVRATIKLIAKRFCWPGMIKDVREWARFCVSCQKSKVIKHNKCPLGSSKTPDAPFDHVHLDLVGPLPDSKRYSRLLTCVERFTRWPEAVPVKDVTSETVARTFVERWVQTSAALQPSLQTPNVSENKLKTTRSGRRVRFPEHLNDYCT
ncbi:unnamed protein product [Schistosoma margrebowiei]|uniref:Uncharacterized protein n=1 Tax=Schistosoma margrebowiei TaxID=48269 RepID=A0A183MT74_9TREM|nr:unnamed protein product [Schistosoma margrebowiei]